MPTQTQLVTGFSYLLDAREVAMNSFTTLNPDSSVCGNKLCCRSMLWIYITVLLSHMTTWWSRNNSIPKRTEDIFVTKELRWIKFFCKIKMINGKVLIYSAYIWCRWERTKKGCVTIRDQVRHHLRGDSAPKIQDFLGFISPLLPKIINNSSLRQNPMVWVDATVSQFPKTQTHRSRHTHIHILCEDFHRHNSSPRPLT